MTAHIPVKRLILRAVLRNVSPIVIRVISVPESLALADFDEVFRTILGWDNLGLILRVHGQEFNSFRRATRSKTLREFQLRPRETSFHTCGAIDLWEWEFRLLDQQPGAEGDDTPLCLGGRGTTPPEHCGGPTGYRLMFEAAKAARGDVHARADGGRDRNACRVGPRRAGQYLADAARSAGRWHPLHRPQAAKIRALGAEALPSGRGEPTPK